MTQQTLQAKDPGLTIGQLARAADVGIETIRYYQRIGLIEKPVKPAQGYRRYPSQIVARLQFIKRAQELGFTLNEIADLLSLNDRSCDEARAIAEHKREVIKKRIDDLSAMQTELTKLIKACKRNVSGEDRCAIIATLAKNRH